MTAVRCVFSSQLYPRIAVETTAARFSEVCPVQVEAQSDASLAVLDLPADASRDLVAEFCNAVLAAAIELHLGMSSR